jgi:Raf kinase inhibitor-like YbhB/YbcL family protein
MYRVLCLAAAAVLLGSCSSDKKPETGGEVERKMPVKVTSPAFKEGEMIPKQYTCDGVDESPPLAWDGVPALAKSIALICDDPDAPRGTWVHWVLYDLPSETKGLPAAVGHDGKLPNGAKQGKNDFGKLGYGGPCPPSRWRVSASGTHRYFFRVYALDTNLTLEPGATKAELLRAMEGHTVAEGQLMSRYSRK